MMPFFLRTRRLTLDRLERKPPENLDVVHAALRETLRDALARLKRMEKSYYGPGKSAKDDAKTWAKPIGRLLTQLNISGIAAAFQIDGIIRQLLDPQLRFTYDMLDLDALKDCWNKIRDAVPYKFTEFILDLRRTLKYLEKYCLSFSDLTGDVSLDTATEYAEERRDVSRRCREMLTKLETLSDKFLGSGFFITDLSGNNQDLARKCNAQHMPFLLMFSEACEIIRETCALMTSWIDSDGSYASFVLMEMRDLEKQEVTLEKQIREAQHQFHKLRFRMNAVNAEWQRKKSECSDLEEKEDELMIREELLVNESNEMQLEVELKEYRKDELSRNADNIHPEFLRLKLSEISEELRDLKTRLPSVQRQIVNVRHKSEWIAEKKRARDDIEGDLMSLRARVEVSGKEQEGHMEKLSLLTSQLEAARKIYLFKTSPDVMQKIYYDQDICSNSARLPGQQGDTDPFGRACHVVSLHLGSDWPRLYRTLPFVPKRGATTIDRDVAEFSQDEARVGQQDIIGRCLDRWRRFHSRAKLEDLRETLSLLGRRDVLRRIEEELNPQPKEVIATKDVYLHVDPDLVPFLREVERFDELRAANRL